MTVRGSELEEKKIFLVVSELEERRLRVTEWIQKRFSNSTVFQSGDGSDALFRIQNFPPHVLIIDAKLSKIDGFETVRQILDHKQEQDFSVILMTELPETDIFIDQVVSGKVQFLSTPDDEAAMDICITRALNRITHIKVAEYTLHFVAPGQYLFREGDLAKHVFIVKRGRLKALKMREGKTIELGEIGVGEFVGEMAHLNHEPRSASVQALEDCELIEIPNGSLDMVLFSRPAWAQALVATLSRRLRVTSDALAQKLSQ